MQTLTVSIIQAELHWQDAQRNRSNFASAITSIDQQTDLIILPEMFTTGFTMEAQSNAEKMDGATVDWMRETAASSGANICGSLIIQEQDSFYNRFVSASPDGAIAHYDKRHLFRLAGEHEYFSPGTRHRTFEINGFTICPMICYDLRFPVWSRNRQNYDLLIYVANWPSPRHQAWETLLRARAIENLSYVVGVNRVGVDGNDLRYDGGSCIVDSFGNDLQNLQSSSGIATATLDLQQLAAYRKRFAFHKDADDFEIS